MNDDPKTRSTYGIITDADSRCNISEGPKTAFGIVDTLFLEVLELLLCVSVA
jgi:hypothetical protein